MKRNDSGNVLFLILIAVALFAALSYIVTQSTRTSGGSPGGEKAALDAASISQLFSSLNLAITRMAADGVAYDDIVFYREPNDACAPSYGLCSTGEKCLFAPDGGSVIVPAFPRRMFTEVEPGSALPGTTFYDTNIYFECKDEMVDWSGMGADGLERVVYILKVTKDVCFAYNKVNLGIDGYYDLAGAAFGTEERTGCYDDAGANTIYSVLYAQ